MSPARALPHPAPGSMLNKLGLSFACVFLLIGTTPLYDAVSTSDATQTATVIGGAVSFSLGLVTMSLIAKDCREWRRHYKKDKTSVPN